jgi:hypothetical protein
MPAVERPEPVGVSFRELVERVDLNLASLSLVPDTGSTLDLEYEIAPEAFLLFAEKDLLQDDVRGLVNGLSNAKRAIDCQVEKLFACLGLPSARSFPKKMGLLMEKKQRTPVFRGNSTLKASDRGYRELIRLCFSFDKSPAPEDDFRKYLLFILDS